MTSQEDVDTLWSSGYQTEGILYPESGSKTDCKFSSKSQFTWRRGVIIHIITE